ALAVAARAAAALAALAAVTAAACGAAPPPPPPDRAPDPPRPRARVAGPTGRAVVRPRFTWSVVPGATSYQIEVAACGRGATTCQWDAPLARAQVARPTWQPDLDLARGRASWRVRACADTCSPWARPRWLAIGAAPVDLDGDGLSDAIAGAPLVDLGGRDRGAV